MSIKKKLQEKQRNVQFYNIEQRKINVNTSTQITTSIFVYKNKLATLSVLKAYNAFLLSTNALTLLLQYIFEITYIFTLRQ